MVDASLGGKTGIDLPEGKNLAGAFYPPRLVLVDPLFLDTLPLPELRCGMAEVVKAGVIADEELFAMCARGWEVVLEQRLEIIRRAMAVKIAVIVADPYEGGLREVLNFGHTIGHAIEKSAAYRMSHGEAVAIGMLLETRLAEMLDLAEPGLAVQITSVLETLGLPVRVPSSLPAEGIIRAMRSDKKRQAGKYRFSLPVRVGEMLTGVEVAEEMLWSLF
jgi:3-dehydroquinate synthetase